jgi:hypothetical protein
MVTCPRNLTTVCDIQISELMNSEWGHRPESMVEEEEEETSI